MPELFRQQERFLWNRSGESCHSRAKRDSRYRTAALDAASAGMTDGRVDGQLTPLKSRKRS